MMVEHFLYVLIVTVDPIASPYYKVNKPTVNEFPPNVSFNN